MKKHQGAAGATAVAATPSKKRRQRPLNLEVKDRKRSAERDHVDHTLLERLRGRDLTPAMTGLFLLILCFQVFIHFQIFHQKPVPGPAAEFFSQQLGYQNIDVPGWVWAGIMLPGNAPKVRAMRPLFPMPLAVARTIGALDVGPEVKNLAPGAEPRGGFVTDYARAFKILLGFNSLLAIAALWIFFALCRHFGMQAASAAMATIAAGSGFGFSFWVTQAVPEVFGYFAVAACLAAIVVGFEIDGRYRRTPEIDDSSAVNKPLLRQAVTWGAIGLIVGVLLLGKEVFSLPIFGALLLLGARRWVGLVSFCIMVLVPTFAWNFYMSKIVGAFDPGAYLKEYKFIIWLYQDLAPLDWGGRVAKLWINLRSQLTSFGQAFAYVPVALAVVGMICCGSLPRQRWIIAAFFLSFYLLFLMSNFIMPRLLFMTWPFVFYFGWLGVEWVAGRISRIADDAEAQRTIAKYLKLASLAGLVILGTRHQFAWYYYG